MRLSKTAYGAFSNYYLWIIQIFELWISPSLDQTIWNFFVEVKNVLFSFEPKISFSQFEKRKYKSEISVCSVEFEESQNKTIIFSISNLITTHYHIFFDENNPSISCKDSNNKSLKPINIHVDDNSLRFSKIESFALNILTIYNSSVSHKLQDSYKIFIYHQHFQL